MVKLSIIIINYKSISLIRNCLSSLFSGRFGFPLEIIIVNNDESISRMDPFLAEYPETQWVDMKYNAGFARANNEGMRRAKGETILLLNPDTILPPGALENCFYPFVQSEYIACGVQLLNEDGSPQISGNYFIRGGLNYLLPLPYLGKFIQKTAKAFSLKTPHVAETRSLTEVDWINGAFLMVKKSAIQKAGMMDEDFFLYAEEAEWCARLKKTGKLCIYGSVNIFHLQGITSNEAFSSKGKGYYNLFDRKGYQIILSNLVRIRKQYGIFWFLFILFVYTVDIPIFFIGLMISILYPISRRTYHFTQWRGFSIHVLKVWSKVFIILGNRPYFYKVL